MKWAGKWTVQQAAELSVAAPTIEAALDGRFLSGLKDERLQASKFYQSKHGLKEPEPLKVKCTPIRYVEICLKQIMDDPEHRQSLFCWLN